MRILKKVIENDYFINQLLLYFISQHRILFKNLVLKLFFIFVFCSVCSYSSKKKEKKSIIFILNALPARKFFFSFCFTPNQRIQYIDVQQSNIFLFVSCSHGSKLFYTPLGRVTEMQGLKW